MEGDCKPGFQPLRANNAKLNDFLMYMRKFKTPLAPVYEMNHIEYILQKLEGEIAAFNTVQLSDVLLHICVIFHFSSSHNYYYITCNITKVLIEF
jgi:hypothetical protein